MSKIKENIENCAESGCSCDEDKNIYVWMKNNRLSEENKSRLKEFWDGIEAKPDETTERSFEKLCENLIYEPSGRKTLRRWISRVAACLLIPVLAFSGAYIYLNATSSQESVLVEHFAANGEIKQILLPDNSTVSLNSGSVIIYPDNFQRDRREIYLYGEAYFSVTKDAKKPFVVKTTDFDVTALGTSFNVSSYQDNEKSSATLIDGSVEVEFKDGLTPSTVLQVNEKIVYDRRSAMASRQNSGPEEIFWKEGHLIFESMKLKDVFKVIERKYAVMLYIGSNKFNEEIITAKFVHDEGLEECLKAIGELVPRMKYKVDGEDVYIY